MQLSKKKWKKDCPVPDACKAKEVVYQADVHTDKEMMTYYGQALDFKERYYKHKGSFKNEDSPQATALSRHIWRLKNAKKNFEIKWSYKYRTRQIASH